MQVVYPAVEYKVPNVTHSYSVEHGEEVGTLLMPVALLCLRRWDSQAWLLCECALMCSMHGLSHALSQCRIFFWTVYNI